MIPLAAIGVGLMAGSSVWSGFLGASEKKSQKALAKYNALLAEKQAKAIEERTKFQMSRQAKAGERLIGHQTAALGASGMAMGAGGVGDEILAEQRSELELENLMIGYEGLLEASQARSQAAAYRMQAKMFGQQARNSIIMGFLGAGSSIGQGLMSVPKMNPEPAPDKNNQKSSKDKNNQKSSKSTSGKTASGRAAGSGSSSRNLPSSK